MNVRSRIKSGVRVGRNGLINLLNEPRVQFGKLTPDVIPKAPGVYLVYEGDEPVYVGSSKNLRRRVRYQLLGARKHYLATQMIRYRFHSKHKFQVHLMTQCSVRYMDTEGADEAKWLEKFVAGVIRPIYNGGSKAFQYDK